jgi:RNA recognition motif-containing protein
MNGNPKIFVANLSLGVREEELRGAFGAHGTVVEVNLMMDRVSGLSRGFAFVTMGSAAEAQQAMNGLNGKMLDGCALAVNLAKPRRERRGQSPLRRRRSGGHRHSSRKRR